MFLDKIFGNQNDKEIKRIMKTVEKINELEAGMQKLQRQGIAGQNRRI